MRPSTGATFNHEVAVQHLLRRDVFNLFAIFDLESGVHSLHETDGVARAARSLVSHVIQKVEAWHVSEIVMNRKVWIRNFTRMVVILLELLSFLKSLLKCLGVWTKFLRSINVRSLINIWVDLYKLILLPFVTILALPEPFMVQLKLASIHLHPKVSIIHSSNEQIHFVRWFMIQM